MEPPSLPEELRNLLLWLTLACLSKIPIKTGWIDREDKKLLSQALENGCGLIKSGLGLENFTRASRAMLQHIPHFMKSCIRHWH